MNTMDSLARNLRGPPPPRALNLDEGAVGAGERNPHDHEHQNVFDEEVFYQDDPFQDQDGSPQMAEYQRDQARWSTRATIMVVEAIAVMAIVGFVMCLCVRKQRARRERQRLSAARQLQEWATIRVLPPAGHSGGVGVGELDLNDLADIVSVASGRSGSRSRRRRVESGLSGMSVVSRSGDATRTRNQVEGGVGVMSIVSSRDGRIRVESGLSGMGLGAGGLAPDAATRQEDAARDASAEGSGNGGEEAGGANRTVRNRLLAIPRAIGSIVMYPIYLLETCVNDWATENYDEVFLRRFMERLEAEREAAMENPQEREVRLKEAFVKACMVWELDEENFIPPSPLFELSDIGGKEDAAQTVKSIVEDIDNEVGYGLHPLGKTSRNDLEYAEVGRLKDDLAGGTGKGELEIEVEKDHAPDDNFRPKSYGETKDVVFFDVLKPEPSDESSDNVKMPAVTVNDQAAGNVVSPIFQETPKDRSAPISTASLVGEDAIFADPDATKQAADEDRTAVAKAEGTTISVPPVTTRMQNRRPRSMSDPTSPSSAAMAPPPVTSVTVEESFDPEVSPGFLYLNTSSHRRRGRTITADTTDTTSGSCSGPLNPTESVAPFSTLQASLKIHNECAICLCEYEKGDVVVTSCDSACPHAFHQECIVEWLVKMQEGTPCPCCRRQFVELPDSTRGDGNNANATGNAASNGNGNASGNVSQEGSEEAERLRRERRRRHIELGIQRGRAFNMSVISIRGSSNATNGDEEEQDLEESERIRRQRRRESIELGIRRGGRAFNTSLISMR